MDRETGTLETVLEKHAQVFKEGLGTLTGTEVKIYVDEEAKPRFFKARPLPYVL